MSEAVKKEVRRAFTIETCEARAAFLVSALNLSRAPASDEGRFADVMTRAKDLENTAQLRVNDLAMATQVRHAAARLAGACAALAVEGDESIRMINLDELNNAPGGREHPSPVRSMLLAIVGGVELIEKSVGSASSAELAELVSSLAYVTRRLRSALVLEDERTPGERLAAGAGIAQRAEEFDRMAVPS